MPHIHKNLMPKSRKKGAGGMKSRKKATGGKSGGKA